MASGLSWRAGGQVNLEYGTQCRGWLRIAASWGESSDSEGYYGSTQSVHPSVKRGKGSLAPHPARCGHISSEVLLSIALRKGQACRR